MPTDIEDGIFEDDAVDQPQSQPLGGCAAAVAHLLLQGRGKVPRFVPASHASDLNTWAVAAGSDDVQLEDGTVQWLNRWWPPVKAQLEADAAEAAAAAAEEEAALEDAHGGLPDWLAPTQQVREGNSCGRTGYPVLAGGSSSLWEGITCRGAVGSLTGMHVREEAAASRRGMHAEGTWPRQAGRCSREGAEWHHMYIPIGVVVP